MDSTCKLNGIDQLIKMMRLKFSIKLLLVGFTVFAIFLFIGQYKMIHKEDNSLTKINTEDYETMQNFNFKSENKTFNQTCLNYYNETILNDKNSTKYINNLDKNFYKLDEIEKKLENSSIELGGKFSPKDCETEQKIAIIIPYRDREKNLMIFLSNMHTFLMKQNISYGIYIIEPLANITFNRGILMNIGFIESLKEDHKWNCFFFHDVDMLPEDSRNLYKCDNNLPVHYAVSVSKFGYSTTGYFSIYYGGINAFTREQFISINGFSNKYFGWGAEDDDLRLRTEQIYKNYIRRPGHINKYFMDGHKAQDANKERGNVLNASAKKYNKLGINEGLNTVRYTIKRLTKTNLYTHFLVNHSKFFNMTN